MMSEEEQKPDSERDTRLGIFKQAKLCYGPEAEKQVRSHFNKYDDLLKKCPREDERKHIKRLAIAELYKMMNYYQGLVVGGVEIIPPDKTD